MKRLNSFAVCLLTFVLACSGLASIAAESNSLAAAPAYAGSYGATNQTGRAGAPSEGGTGQTDSPRLAPDAAGETNAQETLRAYLQLQEQLRVTRLAIEHDRLEAEAASARSAEALASRLQAIEQSLASQRAQELEVLQSSNRLMLVVAATLAGAGLLTILLMAYSHWRTLNRLAEIAGALPAGTAIRVGPALPALDSGERGLVAASPAEQSNLRLLDAVERLEKRLLELEHTAGPQWSEAARANNGLKGIPVESSVDGTAPPEEAAVVTDAGRITSLLGKGESLLNLDKAEAALACFDEALALAPNHTEALVKKGTVLERLRKLDEAIECYDRAIAADRSMTIAYLYKGGLFNRMARFSEALECYEQALRTQERRG